MVPGRLPSIATTTTCLVNRIGASQGESFFYERGGDVLEYKTNPRFCLLKV